MAINSKDIFSKTILIIIVLVGISLGFWFFSVLKIDSNNTNNTKKVEINRDLYNKIVNTSNNSQNIDLNDQDFGRSNPFISTE